MVPSSCSQSFSINDDADSEKGENDFAVFKNVFNDYDTSKIIRGVIKMRGEACPEIQVRGTFRLPGIGLFFLILLKQFVDLGAKEDNVHADVEPQHEKDDGGQAAVDIRKVGDMVNVERVHVGKDQPSEGGESSPRNLLLKGKMLVGQDGVEQHKKQHK